MNSKFEKVLRGSAFGALLVLFVSLPGCPTDEGDGLTEGAAYEVEIQVLEDGTLYAVEIEPAEDGEDEDGDEEEDGGVDGEEEDDDGEVETGFSVQVDAIAEDCSSFTVFGSLTVVLEPEEGEADETLLIGDLAVGMWVEAEGELGADGAFHAEEIEAAEEAETEIEAVLENLTGTAFTMIGLTIMYDADTVIGDDEEDDEDDD